MLPLSFGEFMSAYEGTYELGLDEYMTYGGLPLCIPYANRREIAARTDVAH